MPTIARKLPNKNLAEWNERKPTMAMAQGHLERVLRAAPKSWRAAIARRFDVQRSPVERAALSVVEQLAEPPEWAQAWDLMQAIADFEDQFGNAAIWNLEDYEIREMAKRLAAEADELDALAQSQNLPLAERVDSIRLLVRMVGITEDKPIVGEPAIKRAQDDAWWRRRLRVHVARTVEAGNVGMGLVHKGRGGYVSGDGLQRRQSQLARNAEALKNQLFRNEAGQVWRLDQLAALGTANPIIRGGELMTRIRGAEEYADAHAHVGLFITLTLPSRFHAITLGSGGRARPNRKFTPGITPRDGQQWLRAMWAKTRASLARKGVKMYGLRVAEPHHDATPHWHMLVWAESEAGAQAIEARIRHYWLSEDGEERGAQVNRINVKRMVKGGAAGYVAKYIAKSVGHIALTDHMDLVDGQQITLDFGPQDPAKNQSNLREPAQGYQRVDAWAATWGIRQFQTIGMPSVTVWRELRRVTPDQLELFVREGDRTTKTAYEACHRHGEVRADWRAFMEAMGGHARKRCEWRLRIAHRPVEQGQTNRYGDALKVGCIVGLQAQQGRLCGHWLISRRIFWRPVSQDEAGAVQGTASRAALPRAWTGFNNCTARLTGAVHRQVFGPGKHYREDWCTPAGVAEFRRALQREALQ